MEKGTQVQQIERAARLLHEAGIEVGFFLQFGYPGETFADIELTLDMVRRCAPDDIGISVSYPLPGTPFHERVRAQLGTQQNWVNSSDLAMMYQATYSTEFYRALHAFVHARFRMQRASAAARAIAASPRRAQRSHYGALVAGASPLVRLPLLARRVRRLARARPQGGHSPVLVPLLSQAISGPSV